jgi:hypothetical protein
MLRVSASWVEGESPTGTTLRFTRTPLEAQNGLPVFLVAFLETPDILLWWSHRFPT